MTGVQTCALPISEASTHVSSRRHNCINFHVSKELGVVRVEVVVDDKPVYCLLNVLVHNELLWAYHR